MVAVWAAYPGYLATDVGAPHALPRASEAGRRVTSVAKMAVVFLEKTVV